VRSDLAQRCSDADAVLCCQQAFVLRCAPTDCDCCLLECTFGSANVCFNSGEVNFSGCSTVAWPTVHVFLATHTHTHTHTHIQPPAARVNTDAQKPLQLLSTVLNAECTFHKHSFLRRVNMSVKRFLGHPVFIIECEGCYSRV
jgi:hypothetical protein